MEYTTRPLSDQTWLRDPGLRRNSQFSASWSSTLDLLDRELGHLDAERVVIGMHIDESEIRMDGLPRASAHPRTPAVEIAFDSKYGPLIYRCDEYTSGWRERADSWQHNVRAIALTLEALRAVDRYGASAKGEQYRGYKALEAGSNGATHMDEDTAFLLVCGLAGEDPNDAMLDDVAIRRAKAAAHPDANEGDRVQWDFLEQALTVLGRG